MMIATTLEAPPPPLRRNRNFQLVWVGSGGTFLGLEVADLGYPLVILAMTGSPAAAGAFGVAQTLAALLGGLPAGSAVDRFDQRRLLLLAEGGRVVATTAVAVAFVVDHLTLAHLLVTAVVLGALQPLGAAARMVVVRLVVRPEQLTAALTQEEVRTGAAALAGPPIGGALYGFAAVLPFVFTAVAFTVSWLCALLVRLPARPAPGDAAPHPAGGMFAGIGELWRNPLLRTALLLIVVLNTVGAPLVLITMVVLRAQHVPAWAIGAALSGFAVGGLAGAALVGPVHRRLPPGAILLGSTAVQVPILAGLAAPFGAWWVAGLLFLAGLVLPTMRIMFDVLVFRQIPEDRRGRSIAAFMTTLSLGPPIGLAAGGLLLEFLPPPVVVAGLATVLAAAVAYAAGHTAVRHAAWPT